MSFEYIEKNIKQNQDHFEEAVGVPVGSLRYSWCFCSSFDGFVNVSFPEGGGVFRYMHPMAAVKFMQEETKRLW